MAVKRNSKVGLNDIKPYEFFSKKIGRPVKIKHYDHRYYIELNDRWSRVNPAKHEFMSINQAINSGLLKKMDIKTIHNKLLILPNAGVFYFSFKERHDYQRIYVKENTREKDEYKFYIQIRGDGYLNIVILDKKWCDKWKITERILRELIYR